MRTLWEAETGSPDQSETGVRASSMPGVRRIPIDSPCQQEQRPVEASKGGTRSTKSEVSPSENRTPHTPGVYVSQSSYSCTEWLCMPDDHGRLASSWDREVGLVRDHLARRPDHASGCGSRKPLGLEVRNLSRYESFQALERALATLPPPAKDRVRVYRGQTITYPRMVPTGMRHPEPRSKIWDVATHIEWGLAKAGGLISVVDLDMIMATAVWLRAIRQHYGPGSEYLDVTSSVPVAVWFALNGAKEYPLVGLMGPPGPLDPRHDHPYELSAFSYKPSDSGYLYALDAVPWKQNGIPGAMEFVDLALAPNILKQAKRIQVQKAGLVRASAKPDGDLNCIVVPGTPIAISRPMLGAPTLGYPVNMMFPGPDEDRWYGRLLNIPMTYGRGLRSGTAALRVSLPIWLITDESAREVAKVVNRIPMLGPPLCHMTVRAKRGPSFLRPWWRKAKIEEATIIQLEAPHFLTTPEGQSPLWHHGLLSTDLSETLPIYDIDRRMVGRVSTDNVWFELSPLESGGWTAIEDGSVRVTVPRALWFVRHDSEFAVRIYIQDLPGKAKIRQSGATLRLRFKTESTTFEVAGGRLSKWEPWTKAPSSGKWALVALHLLRFLSSTMKASATPSHVVDDTYFLSVAKDAAVLVQVGTRELGARFHLMLDRHDEPIVDPHDVPFTIPQAGGGMLAVNTKRRFGDVPTEVIRQAVQRLIRENPPDHLLSMNVE
jgi:hypothetical protein